MSGYSIDYSAPDDPREEEDDNWEDYHEVYGDDD